jgi:hypothetical protein
VVAENAGQGTHLHQNFLGMNSAKVPEQNRFAATSYRFLLRLKGETEAKPLKARPFDALRVVWHDYPGEWFEQDVSGPEEAQRRPSVTSNTTTPAMWCALQSRRVPRISHSVHAVGPSNVAATIVA